MPIKRSSFQSNKTLEEFYIRLSEESPSAYIDVGKRMLLFIEMINQLFKTTQLWGVTSHARLALLIEDSPELKWYVIISNVGLDSYYFQYLLPEYKQPWDYAMVNGEAKSLEEAKKYLLIAMRECEGWKGNIELSTLLKEYE